MQFYPAPQGSAVVEHASEAPYPPQTGENRVFGLDDPLQVKQMEEALMRNALKKYRWDMAHIAKVMRKYVYEERRGRRDAKRKLGRRTGQDRRSTQDEPALLPREGQVPRKAPLQRQQSVLSLG